MERKMNGILARNVLITCRCMDNCAMPRIHGQQGNVKLSVSNIRFNISPDIVELFMTLQNSVLSPLLQPAADKPVAKCATFNKVSLSNTFVPSPPALCITKSSLCANANFE